MTSLTRTRGRTWPQGGAKKNLEQKNFGLIFRSLEILVAAYCAIPRDYLSDTPLLRAMGFLVSQHGQLGAIPPPLFWAFPPWRACEVEVRYRPSKGGISAIRAWYPMKTRQNACDAPLCDTISKRYCAIWGCISHWAAKLEIEEIEVFKRDCFFCKGSGIEGRLVKGCQRGVSNGGVSRSGLVLPFLSFLGLSRFFRDFPDLLGDGPGIFPIRPFSLSRRLKSTYEEQSRKGPRHNLDLSRKKWETPRFGPPPRFSCSQTLETQQPKKGVFGKGSFRKPLRRALFCVFLCSEVIFSCKSHRLSGVIRANRKFEWFVRIGLARYKNRGFSCE